MILVLFYGSILFCLVFSAVRVKKYLSGPLHLRWELYGSSSVYELTDWWTRKRRRFSGKMARAVLDALLLTELYRRNKGFWPLVFFFHAGLYLLLFWHVWLFASALLPRLASTWIGWLYLGHLATGLSLIGGGGILIKRLFNRELRLYYPVLHYLKWILILLILMGGFLAVQVHFRGDVGRLVYYVRVQVTFQDLALKLHPALAPASHVFLVSFWLLYLPFSHTLGILLRYYDRSRWDDVANTPGSPVEKKVSGLLERPMTWSASHVQPGENWADVIRETGER